MVAGVLDGRCASHPLTEVVRSSCLPAAEGQSHVLGSGRMAGGQMDLPSLAGMPTRNETSVTCRKEFQLTDPVGPHTQTGYPDVCRQIFAAIGNIYQRVCHVLMIVIMFAFGSHYSIAQENKLVITADNFLDFFNTPPAIDTLIFKRTLASYPQAFQNIEEATKFKEDVESGKIEISSLGKRELFSLRSLPDRQFVIQHLKSINDAWNGSVRINMFNGRDESGWWIIDGQGRTYTDSIETIKDPFFFLVGYRQASEILCLGMYYVDPDTMQKDDSRDSRDGEIAFRASVRSDVGTSKIIGVAEYDEDLIKRIRYSYVPDAIGYVQGRVIHLDHDQDGLSRITVFNNPKGSKSTSENGLYAEYEIIKHVPATIPYREGFCGAEQFLSESDMSFLITGNGDMYDVTNPDNPIKFVDTYDDTSSLPLYNVLVFAFITTVFIAGFLFWRSRIAMTDKQKKQ